MNEGGLTCDAFLGGRVHAWQPARGYRAGTDPVFLAAACPARAGQSVLELGCGVGVASLCLRARVPDVRIMGVERQAAYADLARRNGLDVTLADLAALPAALRARSFDHVIANPPYFATGDGTAARDDGREAALREATPLSVWIGAARARLRPKGWLTMIQSADRLPDCLAALAGGFGAISILPLQSRMGRPARRILLRARKGGKAPFTLLAPLVLHAGVRHEKDGDDFAPVAASVLRDGAPIDWG
ncbi:putative O-methyltransferase [Roseibacterium elongatum DSM 19469]|uniref:Putative O-methyltransferase n=1 Tax=Roseicyclus elongatus DSM 19469 TaxID=1294273 RepID=W8S121_9RHOB|nr:methyltransferase [Roseibacterium elongatum]AHM03857.1 putative O-methyltransferase [Roseibacterium elongatum DSM 19469]